MIGTQRIEAFAPETVVAPSSDGEISEILQQLREGDAWVVPVGGGTALSTGNAVDRVPVQMDLTGLTGILEYEPADLTVSVRAGTRWSDLIATLAAHGQTIPIDVPFTEKATVGGVVAAGWAGPRRLRDGTIKDLLIGASYVRGDGLIAKAGGMVVKNVSGFEIPRLLHGSYGSLAVITSVNLKVIPSHESELTMRSEGVPFKDAADDVVQLTRSEPTIAAAVVDGNGAEADAAIRLSGRAKPIRELADRIRLEHGDLQLSNLLEGKDSAQWWQRRSDMLAATGDEDVMIEVGSTPATINRVVEQLQQQLSGGRDVTFYISPGTGSLTVALRSAALDHASWRHVLEQTGLGGNVRYVVLHAPFVWRSGAQVWSIPEDQRTIMGALKHQFDPEHRLNRGRLWDSPSASDQPAVGTMESMT